jgi:amino acid transporter
MLSFSRLKRIFLGEPLTNQMASHELIPKWKALAVLSSDALSSVTYATEEILIPLIAFSHLAITWSIPIGFAIAALLTILTMSYRQTIEAYPNGGGAYIVAKENLGLYPGLIAAASLLIDYVLTVAVSTAAGVENLASAFPSLDLHKEVIGSGIIFIIMLLNLRGLQEAATLFALPTYLFISSFIIMIVVGTFKILTGAAAPAAPIIHETYIVLPLILLLRGFSSGCSALAGIEAISNGIPMFQAPAQKNAKTTLLWMSCILGVLFLSITLLCHVYGIVPKQNETVVSLLAHQVFGNHFFYYFVTGTTASILFLAANTSYAGFPRLASLLAKDRFLPRQLASMGDRLVFSNGIMGLSLAAIILIVIFKGETHHLLPLYAVGVFLSFTLSQGGMVLHHIREKQKGWLQSLCFNLLGAITTTVVLLVIATSKFMMGAWMVVLFIPILVFCFIRIHNHYLAVGRELTLIGHAPPERLEPIKHTVVIPISGIHRGVIEAIRYALSISDDVRACYVEIDPATTERVQTEWLKWTKGIPFVVLKSPYRSVITPVLQYLDDVESASHSEMITVIIPEFVPSKWWHQILHNQTAFMIRAALLFRKGKVVTSVRYHLKET